jgi:hypothetical protein
MWMSIRSPRRVRQIAEHSMCQPGRPRPREVSQVRLGEEGGNGEGRWGLVSAENAREEA